MYIKYSFAFLLIFTITGCAAPQTMRPNVNQAAIAKETLEQQKLLIESSQRDNARIAKVAFPLLTKNARFCGKKVMAMDGLSAWTIDLFKPTEQRVMRQLYGLGSGVTLSNVIPNSPGAKAGLRAKDILISVNGVKIPTGKNGLKTAGDIIHGAGIKQSQIMFMRNGKIKNTILRPIMGCNYPVLIDRKSSELNAYADGKRVVVSKGMMRFVENDTELALVISHEIAHNTMGHINKKKRNAVAGTLGGAALDILLGAAGVGTGNQFSSMGGQMGAGAYSVAFEQEADYVGMYYMERAGYNAKDVAYFWRRMAVESGGRSLYIRRTHPTSPERFIAIEKAYKEIQNKKRNGLPLFPNIKKKKKTH